jgi:hypothetical protein
VTPRSTWHQLRGEPRLACLGGRYLSTEVAGGFTGRVIGMYASSGAVHFDWFDYGPVEVVSGSDHHAKPAALMAATTLIQVPCETECADGGTWRG